MLIYIFNIKYIIFYDHKIWSYLVSDLILYFFNRQAFVYYCVLVCFASISRITIPWITINSAALPRRQWNWCWVGCLVVLNSAVSPNIRLWGKRVQWLCLSITWALLPILRWPSWPGKSWCTLVNVNSLYCDNVDLDINFIRTLLLCWNNN